MLGVYHSKQLCGVENALTTGKSSSVWMVFGGNVIQATESSLF